MPAFARILGASLLLALAAPGCQRKTKPTTTPPTVLTAEEDPLANIPERPFDYHATTLDNGMQVITLEDRSAPIAAVQLWYHVGSKDEKPDRRGFAHMFEHMMFRGTQNIGPKAHFEYIRRVGGEVNAYTAFDNTTYIQVVPSNQVEMVLWLEAERMAFLKINQGYFDTERKVVAEEYRLGREQPYGTVPEVLLPQIFGKHPYRWSPIGDMNELAAAEAKELQEFWNTYYVPNNAALVVVGDVKHDDVLAMAKTYFGWIPKYPEPPRVTVKEPAQTAPKKIAIREKNGPVPIVAIGYRTVPLGHEDELALQMLGHILGSGESSRLYRRLVTKEELAMFAAAGAFALEDDGVFGAGGVLGPFGKPDKVLTVVREEIAKLVKDGPTDAEIKKAKNAMLRDDVVGQLTIESKAQRLGEAALIEGDVERVNTELREIAKLDRAALMAAAKKHLVPEHEIEVRIEPNLLGFIAEQIGGGGDKGPKSETPAGKEEISGEGSGKPGLVRPATLAKAPNVGPPLVADVTPKTVEKTLANGLRVVVVENHEVPFVEAQLGLKYGAFADPADKPGTAYLALPMLGRGTKAHDYEKLTDELDAHAISLSGSADMDGAGVSASAVSHEAERAIGLLAEVVRTPTFPKKELDRLVDQITTGLLVTERSPSYVADRELRRRMFPGHPYARLPESQAADLHKVDRDGIAAWWSTHARPDAAVLYVAGDVAPEKVFAWAETHFGPWKVDGAAPTIAVAEPPKPSKTKIVLVDRDGAQSQIRVGQVGITRADPRWPAARVISEVFGGGFNSRLNDTIRVKKGLTYGAGGGFSASRFAGRMVISTFSKNATVGETVKTILDEVKRLQRQPPTEAELADAVSFIVGADPRKKETPSDVVDELWMLDSQGLPRDFPSKLLANVRTVERKALGKTADDLVDEKTLVIVVVGPADQLLPQLKKIAEVEVVKK